MKRILGIVILFGFYSTIAIAQQKKSPTAERLNGQPTRIHGRNAEGTFTKREIAGVRRVERHALQNERRAEKRRTAENDRRKIDARRAERSFAKKTA